MRGGLAVFKPCGPSSFDIIRKLRPHLPGKTKVGHAGTLDPAAKGLLMLVVGDATRIQHLLKDLDKTYLAAVRLGIRTDTLDAEGRVIEEREVPVISEEAIRVALRSLEGKRMQRPPAYSALKVQGERAYIKARSGVELTLPEREITIHSIELLSWDSPLIYIRTRVSSGTYIRSLALEIGEELGLPASLAALERTQIGEFSVNEAIGVDYLTSENVHERIIPIERLLSHLPQAEVSDAISDRLMQGKPVSTGIFKELLQAPVSILFSRDRTQAFLCETRQGKLWSRRLIYNNGVCSG